MNPDELAAIRGKISGKPWDYPFGEELLALVDTLTEWIEEAARGGDFMAAQFSVMQREKEHGWNEAYRWESKAERAAAERDALLAQVARVEALGLRWSIIRDQKMRGYGAAILNALAEPAAEGGEQ